MSTFAQIAPKHAPRCVGWFFILLGCLFLSSCFDSEEEFWLNADASGAARVQVSVPAAAGALHGGEAGVKTLIQEFFAANPALKTYLVETSTEKGCLKINVVVTFDNALDLTKSTSGDSLNKLPEIGAEFVGKTEFEFQGMDLLFRRRVELSKAIPGAIFIPKSKLAGHQIKTTVHLPKAATAHNATSSADGGRTLIWSTPLALAISKPVETNFTMPLPIPWAIISFVAFLVLLLAVALIYYLVRRKKLPTNP